MARYQRLALARFQEPPLKPYVRFSRIRLNDDLLDAACMSPLSRTRLVVQQSVTPSVTAFTSRAVQPRHLARTYSRTQQVSRV